MSVLVQRRHLLYSLLLLLCSCVTSSPRNSVPDDRVSGPAIDNPVAGSASGNEIVMQSLALLGTPYRYGGADPLSGMDCSGLVYFVHQALGLAVPRTAREQYAAARRVSLSEIEAGDLLFFRFQAPEVTHVGIYVGEGRFIHAPQSGKPVSLTRVDDRYYHAHLAGIGRLH
jgi:murein DD-endopeptidase